MGCRFARAACPPRFDRHRRSPPVRHAVLRQKIRAPGVAGQAGDRPAAQGAVDMDRAAGDDLGARGDRAEDGDIAMLERDGLARAHGMVDQQRRGFGGGQCRLRRVVVGAGGLAARGGARARGRRWFRSLDGLPGLPAPGKRTSPGLQPGPGRVGALGADDVDAAAGDGAHQLRRVLRCRWAMCRDRRSPAGDRRSSAPARSARRARPASRPTAAPASGPAP